MADAPFPNLNTRADLQRLVDEGLEESLTLDYKASVALARDSSAVNELCKDVSAMANSAGGQLVYGIEEDKNTKKPARVDDGVTDSKITREWIEQILNSRIQPRMLVSIARIDMENGQFGYVITIPQSRTAHQAPTKQYFRRFELQSVAMHDYEIRDVNARGTVPDLYVKPSFVNGDRTSFEFLPKSETSEPVRLLTSIGNRSAQPAFHTLVSIGIASGIEVLRKAPWSYKGLRAAGVHGQQHWFIQRISPPDLPIFKEIEQPLDAEGISLAFHSRTLGPIHRWPITIEIHTPGFSATETWFIQQQVNNLRLLPPGHPLLK
jgi:hypothetical protein